MVTEFAHAYLEWPIRIRYRNHGMIDNQSAIWR